MTDAIRPTANASECPSARPAEDGGPADGDTRTPSAAARLLDAVVKRPGIKERIFSSVSPGPNGCWLYTGSITKEGYGALGAASGRRVLVHRLAYRLVKGDIPDGLVIDHRCHNEDPSCRHGGACLHRRCINPDHLDLVTYSENVLRSPITMANRWASRSHCDNGHELTAENITWNRVRGKSFRRCRLCRNAKVRQQRAARRAGAGDA